MNEKCQKHGLDVCEKCSRDLYETENARLRAEVEKLRRLGTGVYADAQDVCIELEKAKLQIDAIRKAVQIHRCTTQGGNEGTGRCSICEWLKQFTEKRNYDHARGVCNESTCPECENNPSISDLLK